MLIKEFTLPHRLRNYNQKISPKDMRYLCVSVWFKFFFDYALAWKQMMKDLSI